ncbi:MAG: purine-nucleoside phosphorylase [Desulfomonilaceae bacterium]|jgi:purine-nucleoside phosphorylase
MEKIFEKVSETRDFLLGRFRNRAPDVAMILGTGLGGLADNIDRVLDIAYEEIPHFCLSTVDSHRGRLVLGFMGGKPIVVMQGRLHYYEGYDLDQITFPVRVFRSLGAKLLVLNSAAGGLDLSLDPGSVMIVQDHINFMGVNPLRGLIDHRLGDRFPDMSRVYDPIAVDIASEAAIQKGCSFRKGVYAAVAGPSLETPAETKMLRLLGADAVGMSSVPEIITAVQVGFRILFLAVITNVNDPENMFPLSVSQVIENASLSQPVLFDVLEQTLRRIEL